MGSMPTPEQYVSRTGDVTWRVRFRKPGQKNPGSKTFQDARSAKTFAKLIGDLGVVEALTVLDTWAGAVAGDLTVAGWCTEHIDSLSGVQDDSRDRYRAYVRNDLGKIGPLPLSALTPEGVAAWVNELERGGASAKTIKNKHGFLAGAMQHAVAAKKIEASPCEHTRLPRSVTQPMVFLTQQEYVTFLAYVTPHWQPLVGTLFGTGMRWAEATALQVGDVDLEGGGATVVRAWKRGNAIGPPKSKKARRTVSLAPEIVELLRPLVEGRPAGSWVFTNMRGEPVRHNTFHENVWAPAVRLSNGEPASAGKRVARRVDASGRVIEPAAAPLGKRPRVHDARHSNASWLLGAGVPINYVQAHLGHESITTTVDRYGHVMPAARQAVAAALSAALTMAHPQIES